MMMAKKIYGLFDKSINKKLIEQIKADGNEVFLFPKIESLETNLPQEDTILKRIVDFDWIIFTDVFAVDFFVDKLKNLNIELFELDNVRICAYGESVADRLRFDQIHSDVIANKLIDGEVFQQITDYLFDKEEFRELRLLLIKRTNREFVLEKLFEGVQSNLTRLAVYEPSKLATELQIKTLTKNGAFDEFIFTSSDDIFEFSNLFFPETLPQSLNGIESLANNEATFKTLLEFGLKPSLYK